MPHQTEKKNSVDTETRHKKMMTSRILIISERRHSVHATRTGGYKKAKEGSVNLKVPVGSGVKKQQQKS